MPPCHDLISAFISPFKKLSTENAKILGAVGRDLTHSLLRVIQSDCQLPNKLITITKLREFICFLEQNSGRNSSTLFDKSTYFPLTL